MSLCPLTKTRSASAEIRLRKIEFDHITWHDKANTTRELYCVTCAVVSDFPCVYCCPDTFALDKMREWGFNGLMLDRTPTSTALMTSKGVRVWAFAVEQFRGGGTPRLGGAA